MFKRDLTTSKNLALSTIRLQPGSFQRPGSYSTTRTNTRERRVLVSFHTANAPQPVYHGLGFVPTGFTVLNTSKAAKVYSNMPLPATSRTVVLKCDTANTVADILVR